jgi:hypothetical protein
VAQTVGDLQSIAADHPDAPRWWIGDWANEGERRFGVTLEEAVDVANREARDLRAMVTSPSHVKLPARVKADAISLKLPATLSRGEWERLGGIVAAVEAIERTTTASPVTGLARFRLDEVFPADDLVSEWLATIAMGANDLIMLTVLTHQVSDPRAQWYYFRGQAAHFYEIAKHLHDTAELPEIKAFVGSLPERAQEAYGVVVRIFKAEKPLLRNLRQTAFHYPSLLNPERSTAPHSRRALQSVLHEHGAQQTAVRLGRLKDARFLFADDLTLGLAVWMVGGESNLIKLNDAIADGIHAFMKFMNPALSVHIEAREAGGAKIEYSD